MYMSYVSVGTAGINSLTKLYGVWNKIKTNCKQSLEKIMMY